MTYWDKDTIQLVQSLNNKLKIDHSKWHKEKGNITFLMVSVVDSEINIKITYEELINSGNWHEGWINLSKDQSITEEYVNYKSINKGKGIDEIFINEDSLFNIS